MEQIVPKRYPFVTIAYPALEWDEFETDAERIKQAEEGVQVIYDMMYQSDLNSFGKAHSIEMLTDAEIFIRTGGLIDICKSSGECEEDDEDDEAYEYCPTPINYALAAVEENATGKEED